MPAVYFTLICVLFSDTEHIISKKLQYGSSPKKIKRLKFSECVICQTETDEKLSSMKSSDRLFQTLQSCQTKQYMYLLTEASKEDFMEKSPKWHLSCQQHFFHSFSSKDHEDKENVRPGSSRKRTRSFPQRAHFHMVPVVCSVARKKT